ncbi:serine carboxypeptidase-like 7 isoform X1 [Vicia villosa]|uniref:serine carboxypeptidase-like 7 isoform X1 n=1 Tax=Vicia villosa TaxID=3911 RepID=UPI00273CAC98|nr:serine carboxypeptidase-like 7 isoform X1 [Vicia villosa]
MNNIKNMAKFSQSNATHHDFLIGKVIFVVLLLSHISFQVATCGSTVKFLPGFNGPLPFLLETGYVGVGEKEEVQVFYYFIESENNPKEDPLMLWLTGGPGCSALSGLVFEIGPIGFKREEYNGSLPNLILREHSWTKVSSIIFVDLPVSTGFTYATTDSGSQRRDSIQIDQAHQFFRKWLIDHPKFQSNEVYISGDSYSGITLPVIVQEIIQANEKGIPPWINLQGYVLGNPVTNKKEINYRIPFAHGTGLISDELYESLQKNCNGDYTNSETKRVLCSKVLCSFEKAISEISIAHILEPLCTWLNTENSPRRSLINKYHSKVSPLKCRNLPYKLSAYWANDDNVRKALHIRKGSIGKWQRCSFDIPYEEDIPSSFDYHVNLSRKGYRSLIYSGDHDMKVPLLDTKAWIKSLNYSIVDDWRSWYTNEQVSGYTRTYSNQMTFATVKGGGHTAPEFLPEECFAMFSRWISKRPL